MMESPSRRYGHATLILLFALLLAVRANAQQDPLTSWNDGPAKQSIENFVKEVTDKSGAKYVKPEDRIATFDQDGTLWVEHPIYTQAVFALDRLRELAPAHPEWKNREPFKAVIAGNRRAMSKFAEADWETILAVTHSGMSTEAFAGIAKDWLAQARDPRWHRPFTDLVYQPMLEVIDYLRANGFKTYIVTGGGQEFVRVYSQRIYGIPPEQIVGWSIRDEIRVPGWQADIDARAKTVLQRQFCRESDRH